ncbi:hypothetical protein F443_09000, partial [Phytophthora nicotianae P1569]
LDGGLAIFADRTQKVCSLQVQHTTSYKQGQGEQTSAFHTKDTRKCLSGVTFTEGLRLGAVRPTARNAERHEQLNPGARVAVLVNEFSFDTSRLSLQRVEGTLSEVPTATPASASFGASDRSGGGVPPYAAGHPSPRLVERRNDVPANVTSEGLGTMRARATEMPTRRAGTPTTDSGLQEIPVGTFSRALQWLSVAAGTSTGVPPSEEVMPVSPSVLSKIGTLSGQNAPILGIPTELQNAVKVIVPFYSDTATSERAATFWRLFEKFTQGMVKSDCRRQPVHLLDPAQLWSVEDNDATIKGMDSTKQYDRLFTDTELDMLERGDSPEIQNEPEEYSEELEERGTRSLLSESEECPEVAKKAWATRSGRRAMIALEERTMTLKGTGDVIPLGATRVKKTYIATVSSLDKSFGLVEVVPVADDSLRVIRTLYKVADGMVLVEVCNASAEEVEVGSGASIAAVTIALESAFATKTPR